jgi:ABC-type transport system substrate-binding protein
VIPTLEPEWVDILELVAQQWAEVGVDMDVNNLERRLLYERTSNNSDHDCADIAADQFESIGISKSQSEYGVRKNNLANLPDSMPRSWFYPTAAPSLPAQYYFEQ